MRLLRILLAIVCEALAIMLGLLGTVGALALGQAVLRHLDTEDEESVD